MKPKAFGPDITVIETGSVWTSLTTGRDYRLRIDGDYIYTEWIRFARELAGHHAVSRGGLKRDGDKWKGGNRTQLPCYQGQTIEKWFSVEAEFEIDKISATRIEGGAWYQKPSNA